MDQPLTPILLTSQERNHVLAGLRLFQRKGCFADAAPERGIATNDDASPLMDSESIDALCERINTYDSPVETFAAMLCANKPGSYASAARRAFQQAEINHPDHAHWAAIRDAADVFTSDELNVDSDAIISKADGESGAWVQAWVWVDMPSGPCHGPGQDREGYTDDQDRESYGA